MDFATLISAKNDEEFNDKVQALADEGARKTEIEKIRHEIIDAKIEAFASQLGMEYLKLVSVRPNHYMVGGFVFSVRTHARVDKNQMDVVERRKVLFQYRVSLLGFDRTDTVTEILVGTLALLAPEGVRDAFNKAGTQWEFNANGVIPLLSNRPSCD